MLDAGSTSRDLPPRLVRSRRHHLCRWGRGRGRARSAAGPGPAGSGPACCLEPPRTQRNRRRGWGLCALRGPGRHPPPPALSPVARSGSRAGSRSAPRSAAARGGSARSEPGREEGLREGGSEPTSERTSGRSWEGEEKARPHTRVGRAPFSVGGGVRPSCSPASMRRPDGPGAQTLQGLCPSGSQASWAAAVPWACIPARVRLRAATGVCM